MSVASVLSAQCRAAHGGTLAQACRLSVASVQVCVCVCVCVFVFVCVCVCECVCV